MNKNLDKQTNREDKETPRDFWLSSFSIKNRTTVVLLMLLLLVAGAGAYQSMPKENYPEIREFTEKENLVENLIN